MKSDFVDFLGLFHFSEKYVRIGQGERPGEMDITIRGPWLHTIMYEIPVLAMVSEIYFRRTQPRPDLEEGRRRLRGKIELVRTVERELDVGVLEDSGTSRLRSACTSPCQGRMRSAAACRSREIRKSSSRSTVRTSSIFPLRRRRPSSRSGRGWCAE